METVRNFQFVQTETDKPEGLKQRKKIGVFMVFEDTKAENEYYVYNPKNSLYYNLKRVAEFDSVENDFMGAIMAFCNN